MSYAPVEGTKLYEITKGMKDTLIMKYRAEPLHETSKLKDKVYQSLDEYLNILKGTGSIKDYLALTVCWREYNVDITVAILLEGIEYNLTGFSI